MAVGNWKEKNQIENHQYGTVPLKQLNAPAYCPVQSEDKNDRHNQRGSIVTQCFWATVHFTKLLKNVLNKSFYTI